MYEVNSLFLQSCCFGFWFYQSVKLCVFCIFCVPIVTFWCILLFSCSGTDEIVSNKSDVLEEMSHLSTVLIFQSYLNFLQKTLISCRWLMRYQHFKVHMNSKNLWNFFWQKFVPVFRIRWKLTEVTFLNMRYFLDCGSFTNFCRLFKNFLGHIASREMSSLCLKFPGNREKQLILFTFTFQNFEKFFKKM